MGKKTGQEESLEADAAAAPDAKPAPSPTPERKMLSVRSHAVEQAHAILTASQLPANGKDGPDPASPAEATCLGKAHATICEEPCEVQEARQQQTALQEQIEDLEAQ